MSSEEKLARQLDDIASSIIKALEGLEKELSEYIEITNKRLHVLEDKMQKLESLADVTDRGLVKAIESSKPEENTDFIHTRPSQPIVSQPQHSITTTNIQPKITSAPPIATIPHIENEIEQPKSITTTPKIESEINQSKPITDESKLPPVPIPPTFQPEMEDSSSEVTPPTIKSEDTTISDTKPDDPTKKKDSEDKDELMSALKIIDSL